MATLVVRCTHIARRQSLLAQKRVDERRFTDAAFPKQKSRRVVGEDPAQLVDGILVLDGDNEEGHLWGDETNALADGLDGGLVCHVSFRKHEDRRRLASRDGHHLPHEQPLVDPLARKGLADEHDVDISGQYLTTRLSLTSDAFDARDLVATGQHALDDGFLVAMRMMQRHPIPHRHDTVVALLDGGRKLGTLGCARRAYERISPVKRYDAARLARLALARKPGVCLLECLAH